MGSDSTMIKQAVRKGFILFILETGSALLWAERSENMAFSLFYQVVTVWTEYVMTCYTWPALRGHSCDPFSAFIYLYSR